MTFRNVFHYFIIVSFCLYFLSKMALFEIKALLSGRLLYELRSFLYFVLTAPEKNSYQGFVSLQHPGRPEKYPAKAGSSPLQSQKAIPVQDRGSSFSLTTSRFHSHLSNSASRVIRHWYPERDSIPSLVRGPWLQSRHW